MQKIKRLNVDKRHGEKLGYHLMFLGQSVIFLLTHSQP